MTAVPAAFPRGAAAPARVTAARVFGALLLRDLRVVRREIVAFLVRTTMQPLLLTVVFGYLLPKMGFVQRGYTAALLPGILGISLAFSSLQSVALEKVVSGSVQGVIAALFVLPVARLIMGPIDALTLTLTHAGEGLVIIVLGAATFSALGLLLGTALEGQHIGLMFSVIVAPMIMFGCAYYPWRGLDHVPVMKYAVLVNPLVYVAEGMRGALTPSLPHMPFAVVVAALAVIATLFWRLGLASFMKRAVS